MKPGCCIFSEKIKCIKHYCRDCPNAPDLQKTKIGTRSLEYIMRIAISDSRRKNEQPFRCMHGVDKIKNCPAWVYEIFDFPTCGSIPGHDHVKIFEKDGDFVVTFEPYYMQMEDTKELIVFCDKRDLIFKMDGVSSHNPGHTFRIYIYKIGGNAVLGELITNY